MNQPRRLQRQNDDAIEMTYIYLAEVEALVERLSNSETNWFDRGNLHVLLALTQYLRLKQLGTILAGVSESELKHGVASERSRRIRAALYADKLHLYRELDADCNNRPEEMEDAA